MTRYEALKAADEYVTAITSERNERGYAKVNMTPRERITEVLRVAEFLLREPALPKDWHDA